MASVPQYVRPVDGVAYDAVPTEHVPALSIVEQMLVPRRPSGWGCRSRAALVVPPKASYTLVDCAEAAASAPRLSLDRALAAAERPGVRLCSLCGASAEREPVLRGFDTGFDGGD
ncbi:DUF6233 domain-containing protein (plasmid) [Streptomyces sp. QH1-20]|uniref:DUF6233 domain-containing protein n=1 Tax=Streptomyces sp. QH1-20 TaxID=3240934 RepID=UPI003514244C